ncbi:unnamed protein product, partial [Rotaria sp. Silwood1]
IFFNNGLTSFNSFTLSEFFQNHLRVVVVVIILAARLLTILSQDQNFQLKFIENKQNLSIIIDMLNINNDPHLICLILQTLGIIALNPNFHEVLTQADIPDTVLHLILP